MMLLQGTSIAGTPLQNASSKASRYILLGQHYAPNPRALSLSWAGWPRLSGHVSAGSSTIPTDSRCARKQGGDTGIPGNKSPST